MKQLIDSSCSVNHWAVLYRDQNQPLMSTPQLWDNHEEAKAYALGTAAAAIGRRTFIAVVIEEMKAAVQIVDVRPYGDSE